MVVFDIIIIRIFGWQFCFFFVLLVIWVSLCLGLRITVNQANAILEISEAFQDRLTFRDRHMIVLVGWDSSILSQIYWKYRTAAGYLVFWKPWPVTRHIATAFQVITHFRSPYTHRHLRISFSKLSARTGLAIWEKCRSGLKLSMNYLTVMK